MVTDFSAEALPIGVKFCMVVQPDLRQFFSILWDSPRNGRVLGINRGHMAGYTSCWSTCFTLLSLDLPHKLCKSADRLKTGNKLPRLLLTCEAEFLLSVEYHDRPDHDQVTQPHPWRLHQQTSMPEHNHRNCASTVASTVHCFTVLAKFQFLLHSTVCQAYVTSLGSVLWMEVL